MITAERIGERSQCYAKQIKETRHYAFGTISNVRPLSETGMIKDRALIDIACDSGMPGYCDYGPRTLKVGQRVEVFEFLVHGKWLVDFRTLSRGG